uniref:Uncharacterized protein n=1 Tax=Tanacetum cinerariifolium TaxID=118510 RepID=A0A6L2JSA1_TANCI|nr:hypothetical protein [Tanacetum cinerariifolium]
MDDPNITMEEYIRLEEEKARRHGRTFNWQTATHGKMEYCENKDDSFTILKTKYPAIVFDDTSDATLSCEPTLSPFDNHKIDFKISFDESNDEDYMNEFHAIVYNDLKSKSDQLIESSGWQKHPILMEKTETQTGWVGFEDGLAGLDTGDENHIRTLADYSKPSYEGFRNTIELLVGNNMGFPLPVMEFPLPEEVPTASEESSHCQKKRDATAVKIRTATKVKKDSYEALGDVTTTGSASDGTGKKKGRTVTLTIDDMQKRKNDVKARTTLMLSLLDEHQL